MTVIEGVAVIVADVVMTVRGMATKMAMVEIVSTATGFLMPGSTNGYLIETVIASVIENGRIANVIVTASR